MRELLEALPDIIAQTPTLDDAPTDLEVLPPDDDDLIRPHVEEELSLLGHEGALSNLRTTRLAKHLVWTFGPHHRDIPFMLQLRTEIDGDRLVTIDPEIGWLHQGIEKTLQSVSYKEGFTLVERLHPGNPVGHTLAWAFACERLWGIDSDIPPACQLWRTALGELARIHEHLMVLGELSNHYSKRKIFTTFVRAAERILSLLEVCSFKDGGNILQAIGGLNGAIPESAPEMVEKTLPDIIAPAQKAAQALLGERAVIDSVIGLGSLSLSDAIGLGITGPALRACGSDYDTRRYQPYFAFQQIDARATKAQGGGILARLTVRAEELQSSMSIILRALSLMHGLEPAQRSTFSLFPENSLEPECPPAGRVTTQTEVANGALNIFMVSDGSDHPQRVRIHSPSFSLASGLSQFLSQAHLDHVVPILRSLGMVGTEMDR